MQRFLLDARPCLWPFRLYPHFLDHVLRLNTVFVLVYPGLEVVLTPVGLRLVQLLFNAHCRVRKISLPVPDYILI